MILKCTIFAFVMMMACVVVTRTATANDLTDNPHGSGRPANMLGNATEDDGVCIPLKPAGTDASVELVVADPVFDSSASIDDLKIQSEEMRQKWLADNKLKDIWVVDDLVNAGIAYGGMISDLDFDVTTVPVDKYGVYYCSFFSRISVKIFYRTQVMIPSKSEPGTCSYQVIKLHEQMILDANRKAIEDAVKRLKNDLPNIVDDLERGFSERDSVEQRSRRQKDELAQAINLYINDAAIAKTKGTAAAVNTPEEMKLRTVALSQCNGSQTGAP